MILRISALGAVLLASLVSASSSSSPQEIERASNNSLLWGPYRPNLYFGVRPRIPEALSFGLLWANVEEYNSVQDNFRYTCEQNEGMAGYGWEKYDARHGGVQTIHDAGNQIDITTSFFKDTSSSAGDKGGNWGVRIKGTPRPGASKDLITTVVFNVNLEGKLGVFSSLEVLKAEEEGTDWYKGDVVLKGETPQLGGFTVTVKGDKGKKNRHPRHDHPSWLQKSLERTLVNSKAVDETIVWHSKPLLFSLLKDQIDEYIETYTKENLPPPCQLFTVKPEAGPGNVHFIQKIFSGAFEFDVLYSSDASDSPITTSSLTKGISTIEKSFDSQFDSIFKPQPPFTPAKYVEFSKSLFSNLLGGIGYFHGDWKVDRSNSPEYEEENEGFWEEAAEARSKAGFTMEGPNELFTSIPSRPFFPRGFLWDEGFHLMPVLEWDVDLTLQIIKSWFALMDEDGWIAREQILGAEARMKVPDEFQVQYLHYANPPTLFLTLTNFIDKVLDSTSTAELDPELAKKYLSELYPLLKRHYDWFRRTQKGDLTSYDRPNTAPKEAYRWRGRTERHCLTSGQDDFPRAQPPHPGELHVDALAWVSLMSSSLAKISTFLGENEDSEIFEKHLKAQRQNLVDLHWSDSENAFCDATIDEFEEHKLVCHHGYVTLLPFMVGLVPDSDSAKIKSILDILGDESKLWSPHGIRSLSLSDELYGTDENYWRGPIWMNMNYLILSRLLSSATSPSSSAANAKRAAELYAKLRKNLVYTVYESWKETGFAWEQYNPDTGRGQRTQHFTGWTSLVVKILGMPEVAGGKKGGRDEL